MAGSLCDVCRRPEQMIAGVVSSGLGAISFAYCKVCIAGITEPEMMFEFMWELCSGDSTKLVDDMNDFSTWKQHRYWSWPEWVEWRKLQPVKEGF